MDNKQLYTQLVNEEVKKRLKDGFIEITVPEEKAEILSRLLSQSEAMSLDGKNADEIYNLSRVVSGVILVNPIPKENNVYIERHIYFPNEDYDRIMEDIREYATNDKYTVSPVSSNAEVLSTTIESGDLKTQEMEKIQKSHGYAVYKKLSENNSESQPGSDE